MKRPLRVSLLLSARPVSAFAALRTARRRYDPAYKIVDRIKVPDGGFDLRPNYDPRNGQNLYGRRQPDFTNGHRIRKNRSRCRSLKSGRARDTWRYPIPGTSMILLPPAPREQSVSLTGAKDAVGGGLFLAGKNSRRRRPMTPSPKLVFVMNH